MKKMLDLQIKEKKLLQEQHKIFDKKYADDLNVNADKFNREVKQREVKKIERRSIYKQELDNQLLHKSANAKSSMDDIEKVINRELINEIKAGNN
jgi:hypothetical protein